jgi:branched-chain amino acid aminotransferase
VRIQISRGPGEIGLDPALCPAPTMVILVKPFKDYPGELYENGVPVSIVTTRRNHPLAQNPAVKSTNFLNNIMAKIESLRTGAYEGIMLNWKGYVAEGTISNIFSVRKGVLYTPALEAGILEGITRDLVLFLAKKNKLRIREEPAMQPRDLYRADECFITNTTIEIMPVTSVDGKRVGGGKPGPVTRMLGNAYKSEVQRHV